jgi:selenide, water dikinase
LDQVLAKIPRQHDERLLVGFDTADDAGVFRLTPECALVQTVDFFTPIVDDPYEFGAIAAANSLSDVYAMGAKPLTALSVLAWPKDGALEDMEEILRGGAEKIAEAGCVLLGGHSVSDPEPKFGYAVTGTVHPDRLLTNAGARAGDALVLTKAIGTGVIATALKRGIADAAHVRAATEQMMRLNRAACEAMLEAGAHGVTDVTGFGLLGHARELAAASSVTIEIDALRVPLLDGALDYARAGAIAVGLNNNREFVSCAVRAADGLDPAIEKLLYDPQTSGGLLISMPPAAAERMESLLPAAVRIGSVVERRETLIEIA